MIRSMPYFSAGQVDISGPIHRFLPPVPNATGRAYLAGLPSSASLVLDPFAALPQLTIEMARAGHRVLVTAGNPVSRFLLDLAAHPPRLADLQAALADLAFARKEGKRLELHIQSLYFTECENCHSEVPAEAFLWDAKSGGLCGRIYNCACGSGGERPVTAVDAENAIRWKAADSLHRSRALERVAPGDSPDRIHVREALNFYSPRAVYVLGTLINRLDSISTTVERKRCMYALLLYALDCANMLWPHQVDRPRPRQLTLSPVYRENNIWMALEAGVRAWASDEEQVSVALWPDEPPEGGGVCIFEGPLRDVTSQMAHTPIKTVVCVIPRPNQAFWALSALWSGWLWGHEAVGPFRAILRRRRYDWQWHTTALHALFTNLAGVMPQGTGFFGILAEPEPAFINSVFLAAEGVEMLFSGYAFRSENEPIQLLWNKGAHDAKATSGYLTAGRMKKKFDLDVNYTRRVIREALQAGGKPMEYIHLHVAVISALARKGMLNWSESAFSLLETNIHSALSSPEFVDVEDRAVPENGRWAMAEWARQQIIKGM